MTRILESSASPRERVLALVAGFVVLAALGACSPESVAERVVEAGSDGQVDIDDGEITIEGDDGSTTITGGSGRLPDGFPAEVPLVKGDISFAQRLTESGGDTSYTVLVEAAGTVTEVFTRVRDDMAGAGFALGDETITTGEASGSFATATFSSSEHAVTVTVTGTGDTSAAAYLVAPVGS